MSIRAPVGVGEGSTIAARERERARTVRQLFARSDAPDMTWTEVSQGSAWVTFQLRCDVSMRPKLKETSVSTQGRSGHSMSVNSEAQARSSLALGTTFG